MSFSAQLRADIETIDVTINNYERMDNAPEAWTRIKTVLNEVQKPSDNIDKTICCNNCRNVSTCRMSWEGLDWDMATDYCSKHVV